MSAAERLVLTAIVILASIFPVEWLPVGVQMLHGTDGQLSGKQGQVLIVRVPVDDRTATVEGRFLGRTVHFSPEFDGGQSSGFLALLGIDMQDKPGTHELTVDVQIQNEHKTLTYNVVVIKERFAVERLKLPKAKVDLDEKALARYKDEQAQVQDALAEDSTLRLWASNFVEPVKGRTSGRFGSVRILNGKPKNPHRGEDIAAPSGQDVVASNDGLVRLTVDHIFPERASIWTTALGCIRSIFTSLTFSSLMGRK